MANGRFQLGELIGKGAFGKIIKTYDIQL